MSNISWSPYRATGAPETGAEGGRVVLVNTTPMAIWCLTAVTGPEKVEPESDLLQGPIMPGGEQVIDVPPGLYRLVAETGGGSTYRSPLMQVSSGSVARWRIAGENRG
jgi:hypothetical protein